MEIARELITSKAVWQYMGIHYAILSLLYKREICHNKRVVLVTLRTQKYNLQV